jgi:hypothetical protein
MNKIKRLETILRNRDLEIDNLVNEKTRLKQQISKLEKSLKELVDLKTHKDKFGKDEHYTELQPKLWHKARKLVTVIKPNNEGIAKALAEGISKGIKNE